jgi:hypothetical protein
MAGNTAMIRAGMLFNERRREPVISWCFIHGDAMITIEHLAIPAFELDSDNWNPIIMDRNSNIYWQVSQYYGEKI